MRKTVVLLQKTTTIPKVQKRVILQGTLRIPWLSWVLPFCRTEGTLLIITRKQMSAAFTTLVGCEAEELSSSQLLSETHPEEVA